MSQIPPNALTAYAARLVDRLRQLRPTKAGEVVYQVDHLKPQATPPANPRPRGMLSALRRWAIRRLILREFPSVRDAFAGTVAIGLMPLYSGEAEASAKESTAPARPAALATCPALIPLWQRRIQIPAAHPDTAAEALRA